MPKQLDICPTELADLVAADLTLAAIAEHIGCSRSAVCQHMRRAGIKALRNPNAKGALHPAFKGGVTKTGGYLRKLAPDHPNKDANGRVAVHRLVVEDREGRYLKVWEHVHHIDGDKLNNSADNLQIVTAREHARIEKTRHDITFETISGLTSQGLSKREISQKMQCCPRTIETRLIQRGDKEQPLPQSGPLLL